MKNLKLKDILGKAIYFDYVDGTQYNFGTIVGKQGEDVVIHQTEEVCNDVVHKIDTTRVRNLQYDLEHKTLQFV